MSKDEKITRQLKLDHNNSKKFHAKLIQMALERLCCCKGWKLTQRQERKNLSCEIIQMQDKTPSLLELKDSLYDFISPSC